MIMAVLNLYYAAILVIGAILFSFPFRISGKCSFIDVLIHLNNEARHTLLCIHFNKMSFIHSRYNSFELLFS